MNETQSDGQGSRAYRALVLAILTAVYTFNFVDRSILGILAPKLREAFHLDDAELGLLQGPPFAVLFTTLAIPIAWLADRASRTWIITCALTVWSGCTALCGQVSSFPQLLITRVGVGVGEAGGVAPAYSLIADYFPARSRARALAIYAFAIPLGAGLATAAGGQLAQTLGWRTTFLAVGLAGLPLAPLLKLLVRDPVRQPAPEGAKAGLLPALRILLPKPSFWLLSLGAASSSIAGYGLLAWFPSFLVRSFHLGLTDVGRYYGAMLFIGGVTGVWLGGWLGDRLGRMNRAAYALVPAAAFLVTVPFFIGGAESPALLAHAALPQLGLGPNGPGLLLAFVLFLVPTGLSLAWLGPVTAAVQHLTPASMRSTGSALFLLINNLLGLALGPLLMGVASKALKARFGEESLHYAMLIGMGFYLLAALLMAGAARRMRRDWVD
jgi:MFS family permease